MKKCLLPFLLVLVFLTGCSSADLAQTKQEIETSAPSENTDQLEPSDSGLTPDQIACRSVKLAFEDLMAMSEAGYSNVELTQQRITAFESGLLTVQDPRLAYLFTFLRDWNANPQGLSVAEYREMQGICLALGVEI